MVALATQAVTAAEAEVAKPTSAGDIAASTQAALLARNAVMAYNAAKVTAQSAAQQAAFAAAIILNAYK